MNRREFITKSTSLAGLFACAPYSYAQDRNPSPFLFVVYYPNGANLQSWHPRITSGVLGSKTLGRNMSPLMPVLNNLWVPRNLSSQGHGGSSSHPEAASLILSGGIANSPSFNNLIASEIRVRDGASTKFDHLDFGIFTRYNQGNEYLPFRDINGKAILPEDDPQDLLGQIFTPIADNAPVNLAILSQQRERIARWLSSKSLPETSRIKLRTLDQSLQSLIAKEGQTTEAPELSGLKMGQDRQSNNNIAVDLLDDQIKLMAFSAHKNLAQSFALQFMSAQDESLFINFPSIRPLLDRADEGGYGSEKLWWNENLSHPASHKAREVLDVQALWINTQVAKLCKKLSFYSHPVKKLDSVFDHSIILVCSEVGASHLHGQVDLPWYIISGNRVAFPKKQAYDCRGAATSSLFIEIAKSVGLSWSSYGKVSQGIFS